MLEGEDAQLNCSSTCVLTKKSTLLWRKNGEVLPLQRTNNNNNMLLLKNVTPEDEGYYSCELKDHDGHPSKAVKLNVICECKSQTTVAYKSLTNFLINAKYYIVFTICILFKSLQRTPHSPSHLPVGYSRDVQ